jgi:hypothetical protein
VEKAQTFVFQGLFPAREKEKKNGRSSFKVSFSQVRREKSIGARFSEFLPRKRRRRHRRGNNCEFTTPRRSVSLAAKYKTLTPSPLFKTPSFKVPSPQGGRRKRTGVSLSKALPHKWEGEKAWTFVFQSPFHASGEEKTTTLSKYPTICSFNKSTPNPLFKTLFFKVTSPQRGREKQQRCRHIPQFVPSTKVPLTLFSRLRLSKSLPRKVEGGKA